MDPTAQPCQDFFQFACGAWNRKHFIPEDRSSISTFEVLADQQQIVLKGQQRQPLVTWQEHTTDWVWQEGKKFDCRARKQHKFKMTN